MKTDPLVPSAETIAWAMVEGANALGMGMLVVENRGVPRFVFATDAVEAITGYSVDELLELDPLSLACPGERERLVALAQRYVRLDATDPRLHNPDDLHLESVLQRKDGRLIQVEASVSNTHIEGCLVSTVFIVDVSQRKEVERKLRRLEARSRKLLDQAPEAIWVVDRDHVLYANHASFTLFGYDPGIDYTRIDPHDLIHPEDVALFEKRAFTMLGLGQAVPPCEYRLRRRDGQTMIVEVSPVVGEFEGRPAIFAFGRDVTERRRAESSRLQSDRLGALGLLAGGMAHAINNPLTYVMLNLDHVGTCLPRIPNEPTLLSEALVRLTEARDGADRVARVVRQMRALSRTEEHERGPVNLREVIRTAAGMVGHEIRHRGALHVELSEVPPVFGNAARLEQVFLNLLVFVARSLLKREGAHVHLRLRSRERSQAEVELSHDGAPIDPAVRQQALAPIAIPNTDPDRLASGLSFCNGIVRGMGGSMHIECPEAGGTVFRIILPVDTRELALPEPHPRFDSEPPSAVGLRARVMVVDDDAGVIHALRVTLEDDHDVTCVTNGRDALRLLLRGEHYDVVFCDLMMPDVSGMDLYEALRLNRPGRERSLVFMTGGAFTQEAARFLKHIPNPRLDKPFEVRALSKLLRRVVNATRGV